MAQGVRDWGNRMDIIGSKWNEDYVRTCIDNEHSHECPVIRASNEVLLAERDALKAELEKVKAEKEIPHWRTYQAMAAERDTLRSLASRMAEALRIAKGELETIEWEGSPPDDLFPTVDDALAAWDEFVKGTK